MSNQGMNSQRVMAITSLEHEIRELRKQEADATAVARELVRQNEFLTARGTAEIIQYKQVAVKAAWEIIHKEHCLNLVCEGQGTFDND